MRPIKSCNVCYSFTTEELGADTCPVCGNRDVSGWAYRHRCDRCGGEFDEPRCPHCVVRPAPVAPKRPVRLKPRHPRAVPAHKPAPTPAAPSDDTAAIACGCIILLGLVAALVFGAWALWHWLFG